MKEVSRDVPQIIIEEFNQVCWGECNAPKLAKELKRALKFLRLPVKDGKRSVPDSGWKNIHADVPQELLDVVNEVAWSQLSSVDHRRLAARLSGEIAKRKLPYKS